MSTATTPEAQFVALATSLKVHFSAQTEDSTTKDNTDTTGQWMNYDVVGRSGDISFSALLAVIEGAQVADNSLYAKDFIDMVSDTVVDWQLLFVSGNKNREKVKTLCTGQGKLVNMSIDAPNRQKATYSGTLNMYGPITVGND